jgi:hypothetical protein
LARGERLWRAGTPRALPGWNKPGRRPEKEGAERLRKPEGATYRVRQARVKWAPDDLKRRRGRNPESSRIFTGGFGRHAR